LGRGGRGDEHLDRGDEHLGRGDRGNEHLDRGDEQISLDFKNNHPHARF